MTQEELERQEFRYNPYSFEKDGAKVVGAYQSGFMKGAEIAQNDTKKKAYEVFNEFLSSLKEMGMVTDTDEWYKQFTITLEERL